MQTPTNTKAIRRLCNVRETPGVILDCQNILESVESLNEKVRGPLDKNTNRNTIFPFVFLLGNHSSGKSSFVNYLLNRKVQTAGVAPTDDSFTIIAPGPKDVDRDGPSFIGDPDMGFAGLKSFGPTLIHHTQLKVRCNTAVTDFMIVDTPGMIDSPLQTGHKIREDVLQHYRSVVANPNARAMDRGYNFEEVVKWYAERADVILLFFDPDKPGTTGETLSILTNSLQDEKHTLGQGLADLERTREDVVKEVLNTPRRREDNDITRLTDKIHLLDMHCRIVDDALSRYSKSLVRFRMAIFGAVVSSAAAVGAATVITSSPQIIAGTASVATLLTVGVHFWQSRILQTKVEQVSTIDGREGLEAVYKRLYARQIIDGDEYSADLWRRVKDHFEVAWGGQIDIHNMPKITPTDFQLLEYIIENDIPALRRRTAPKFTAPSPKFSIADDSDDSEHEKV
ncbi:EHD2 [Symbiodinium microadriaticum]|nr:EHD2 [Symbiodinium microadriaticum]